jgi:hypothetical protein
MTQDEFSDDLIRHCEQEALGAVAADTADLVRAVLSASGYARLVAERDIAWASNAGLTTDVLALRAQNAELVAALEFYARGTANTAHKSDPEDWEVKDYSDGSTRSIAIKFGERARSALAAAGHKQGSGE